MGEIWEGGDLLSAACGNLYGGKGERLCESENSMGERKQWEWETLCCGRLALTHITSRAPTPKLLGRRTQMPELRSMAAMVN